MKRYHKIEDGNEVFFTGNVLHIDGATIVNPSEEQMTDAGWQVWVAPEPTAEELLARAKAEKIAEIDALDATKEQFAINGQQMWLGHELRQQLKTSVEAYAAMHQENVTKWFGGQEFTFPVNAWLAMLAALEVYAAEVLNTTEAHKVAVESLDSVDAVDAYDITAGYPEPLVFTPQTLAAMGGQE